MFNTDLDPKKIYRYDSIKKSYNIDISIDFYSDLYNEWDYSPLNNRDIDEDLYNFLKDCAYEIPLKSNIIINFYLPKNLKEIEREKRSLIGFNNYLTYSIRKQKNIRKNMIKNTLLYAIIGSLLLVSSLLLQNFLTKSFLQELLPQGLIIGGWVLIWEIFSIIFFQINVINTEIKTNKHLLLAQIIYHYT